MNLLVEQLPLSVTVNDEEYSIDTDFRTCIRVLLAFEDQSLTPQEKAFVLLNNLYIDGTPADVEQALRAGVKFLDGGNSNKEGDEEQASGKRYYSFAKDSSFIYAAFNQTHGIDLQTASIHWWTFMALFMDLGKDTTFTNLVSLRRRVKSGAASKEERKAAEQLGDVFDIPDIDTRTLEEKRLEQEFLNLIGKGGQ